MSHTNFAKYVTLYLRLTLAAAYLSSLADRFGIWGAGVGWGNFANFLDLILFAIGMSVGLGVKSPLDYSVFTASAASFLLAVYHRECLLCVDVFLRTNSREEATE